MIWINYTSLVSLYNRYNIFLYLLANLKYNIQVCIQFTYRDLFDCVPYITKCYRQNNGNKTYPNKILNVDFCRIQKIRAIWSHAYIETLCVHLFSQNSKKKKKYGCVHSLSGIQKKSIVCETASNIMSRSCVYVMTLYFKSINTDSLNKPYLRGVNPCSRNQQQFYSICVSNIQELLSYSTQHLS